ncbi:hypothetical protein VP14_065 [Vibrio phage VPMCC14]|nr:hypothetical protein VP14_065 [Vibrio phage VPMCC14]
MTTEYVKGLVVCHNKHSPVNFSVMLDGTGQYSKTGRTFRLLLSDNFNKLPSFGWVFAFVENKTCLWYNVFIDINKGGMLCLHG